MKKLKLEKGSKLWQADLGNGYYQNPILYADYSDPDVIRVGEDFFMVASSFNMSPCLPLLHSRDLVNWQIVNHISPTFPYDHFDRPRHGEGVWAPSIRYHDDKFWVFFGAPDEGVFMSTTTDPFGKWSPLHLVKQTKGWIDPCPFWDDDGQAYLVNAFAKSRIGFKSLLHISKMAPDGSALLDEGQTVFDGTHQHPTIEGPKLYKGNGYYYIFAPAGGVATGWQTVLRSKSIYGPYEDKIVLHQGSTTVNGPHQGGWMELQSGESWFIHFQDKGAYGRITHLQPMRWENDWPVIGTNVNEQGIGEPVQFNEKPQIVSPQKNQIMVSQTSDEFDEGKHLGLQWQWRANKNDKWYSLQKRESHLRLYAVNQPNEVDTLYHTPQILTQKFPAPEFTTTTCMSFYPEKESDYAGLVILGQEYSGIMVKKSELGLALIHCCGKSNGKDAKEHETVIGHVASNTIFLRVEVHEQASCQLSFSSDGESFQTISKPFFAKPGRWVGAQVGIFCLNKAQEISKGYADFDWFRIHEK